MNIVTREPTLTLAAVQAVVALVVAFGLELSAEQVGAIVAATAALLALVVRRKVTPIAAPNLDDGHGNEAA